MGKEEWCYLLLPLEFPQTKLHGHQSTKNLKLKYVPFNNLKNLANDYIIVSGRKKEVGGLQTEVADEYK